jgi:hypothetical protein
MIDVARARLTTSPSVATAFVPVLETRFSRGAGHGVMNSCQCQRHRLRVRDGPDAPICSASRLSGGQRQRAAPFFW